MGSYLTSLLCFHLQYVWGRPVSHGGERQHAEAVRDVRYQAGDSGQAAVLGVVFLPCAEREVHVGRVVHSISSDLSVGLLWRFPLHQHGRGAQHPGLNAERRRRGGLFTGAGLHRPAGRPTADVIDRHDAEFVLRVRAQATDAVAGGGHSVHFLEAVVWHFGPVLNHIVGYWFGVSRIPC